MQEDGRFLRWRVFAARSEGRSIARVSPLTFSRPPFPSPDGRWLAFAVSAQARVVPLRGTTSRRLMGDGRRWIYWLGPWSPNGRHLLVRRERGINEFSVFVVDVVTRERRPIRADGVAVESAIWAPDGRRLLALRPRLYLIDPRTRAASRMPGLPRYVDWGWFAPDGRLAFAQGSRDRHHLWLTDENGSNPALVLSTRGYVAHVEWSPDGSRLAVVVQFGDDDTWRLVVLPASARGQRITERSGVRGLYPVWSPDSTELAFARGPDPRHDLWVMKVNGSAERRLTHTPVAEYPLAWLADPPGA